MDGSSHAVPNNTANMAHRDAGGGAVHSINSGHDRNLAAKPKIYRVIDPTFSRGSGADSKTMRDAGICLEVDASTERLKLFYAAFHAER
jgi:hypothetical protein